MTKIINKIWIFYWKKKTHTWKFKSQSSLNMANAKTAKKHSQFCAQKISTSEAQNSTKKKKKKFHEKEQMEKRNANLKISRYYQIYFLMMMLMTTIMLVVILSNTVNVTWILPDQRKKKNLSFFSSISFALFLFPEFYYWASSEHTA